jgi:hypothetical protein
MRSVTSVTLQDKLSLIVVGGLAAYGARKAGFEMIHNRIWLDLWRKEHLDAEFECT